MNKGVVLVMTFLMAFGLMGETGVNAKVKTYRQKSSALTGYGNTRKLNNKKVHFVKVPKKYSHISNKATNRTVYSTRGNKVNFISNYLLPYPGKNNQRWGNPQSIAISKSGFMYILYCPTNTKNRGRIVRYNLTKLNALGVQKHRSTFQKTFVKVNGKYSATKLAYQNAIKVGPLFNTGHGQSLAYNRKNHGLYMWIDNEKTARVPVSKWGYIAHISAKSLKPDRKIRFKLSRNGTWIPGGHNLTFDNSGNAYFWTNPGSGANVFKGKIHHSKVKFRRTKQILKHLPGTRLQGMGYNPVRHRLMLVSDDSLASFPTSKLVGKGHLTNGSFNWSAFAPKREFEGVAYGNSSRAYLLVNHNPEVLVSDRSY
ncbi:hypothetical protein [Secundilactobacillus malefermentans]|uniref:hypothetical protein n=1 Tax=Secundilactobacillus malefermentans TaxID=176292 RepID=UPI0011CAF7F7|nr:hypothetical protein [Secundilactobacillus malefermentans]QEA31875.1 hypothetical protein FGL90_06580 [Secundilactobacillus malefermentans]